MRYPVPDPDPDLPEADSDAWHLSVCEADPDVCAHPAHHREDHS